MAKIESSAQSKKYVFSILKQFFVFFFPRIKVDKECEVAVKESFDLLKADEEKAAGLLATSRAEGAAAKSLKVVREYNLKMAKLQVQQSIARSSRMVISGETGDRFLRSMLTDSILGDIKLEES